MSRIEIDCAIRVVGEKGPKGLVHEDQRPEYRPVPNVLDQTIFKGGDYIFLYDYPLSHPVDFTHNLPLSTTAEDILSLGVEDYRRIYAEEEASSKVEAVDKQHIKVGERVLTLANRNRTNGQHGIWGHVIDDLYFERIFIDTDQRVVSFFIGS